MNGQLISLKDLRQVENLELIAKQVVEGFILGLHKSPFHGFSVEFAEHRIYNPGEATRHIDWKVFGRTDKLFTKKYEEETNLRCQIVIDASSSMYFPEPDKKATGLHVNKLIFSTICASAIIHLLKLQRDAAGLTIFTDDLLVHTKSGSSNVHHKLLQTQLESFIGKSSRDVKTDAGKCLHLIAENIHRRSLVLIFSDMFEDTTKADELFSALQHLKHNKHEVVVFHVTDKKHELDFAYDNRPYVFVDMETGEKVKLRSNDVKSFYTEQMEQYIKTLKLRCHQYHIDFVEADMNAGFKEVLLPYLVKRQKQR
ncbi:MAG: DUF58 domain-containing protein [Chitinophagales bacterium]|jgi:uncharacterized protein (DUF58 family)|nr:DUF58 domain-containing protein [Bacteroidota bacterium]MBK9557384.1 DUF58 domain-containing protein [Bacteroidota bacterium]MBL0280547.1 DUF58 domain-containing protein [Bacteroidota bacterium]MBP8249090.1 DUF58 domain-containing protein [Chitinophagales bacterium]MBP9879237.1 DUF58 domain-containing protein [Chitinophagales bacterium]